jgi:hypothetical protein
MRDKVYRSLGFNVTVSVPSSVEENDSLAGKVGATLDDAVDNVVYRSGDGLPAFREALANGIEVATGIKRVSEPVMTKATADTPAQQKKDEQGELVFKYTESEADYIDRVLAQTGRSRESFIDQATAAQTSVKYDPKASERSAAGPKTPPKSVFETVDAIIAAGQHTAVAVSLTGLLGRQVEADRESLAKAIHEDQLNEMRKLKSKYAPKA